MTNLMNRRAALGALAGAGALFASPAALALSANPDAELLGMQPEIDAAEREFEAALTALSHAQTRFYQIRGKLRSDKPSPPADAEWDQILADFANQMAEYRKRTPRPETVAYEEAAKLQELAESKARAESGLEDAKRAEDERSDVVSEIKERLISLEAKTLAGLIVKAKYAAERDCDPDVTASIVDDLLAMANEA